MIIAMIGLLFAAILIFDILTPRDVLSSRRVSSHARLNIYRAS
jgi:hypothetical protein